VRSLTRATILGTLCISLQTGVNFFNFICSRFSYKRHFGPFFCYMYVTCTWKKLPKRCSYEKCAHIKLMKLTAGGEKDLKIYSCCLTCLGLASLFVCLSISQVYVSINKKVQCCQSLSQNYTNFFCSY
jgi:hypothetical protein